MAAKRKAKSSQKAAGRGVLADRDELDAALSAPVEPPAPVEAEAGDDREARPVAPKAGPVPRGGARFTGAGRGQGAPQVRRYAFRRS